MLIKVTAPSQAQFSEITPFHLFQSRRHFLQTSATAAGATLLLPWQQALADKIPNVRKGAVTISEKLTPFKDVTTYNNYYEFGTQKSDPAENGSTLVTHPWKIKIDGEIDKPLNLSLDELIAGIPLEERIYRLRCVEGWSMVIPWIGFPLSKIIQKLKLNSKAKFVTFTTLEDSKQMPGQKSKTLDWPYIEALRIDEAMNPLTILAVGLYDQKLLAQNGAPIRLVVPWKYGFKSAKSIVRISFVEKQPATSWMKSGPAEYGFYSNVNPLVDHPRWSQSSERRIGEFLRRKTLMFNGYADEVSSMYKNMDLKVNF